MKRITRKHLENRVKRICQEHGICLAVEYAGVPQQPKISLARKTKDGIKIIDRDLSPRAKISTIYGWLGAFEDGLRIGYEIGHDRGLGFAGQTFRSYGRLEGENDEKMY